MCGLAGIWDRKARIGQEELANLAQTMSRTLAHRGPDSCGVWVDVSAGVALGHQRLAVVDLAPTGHQPMVSASGRYVIAFNGEVYNFRELRRELELEGVGFRGHADTEVALAVFERWGVHGALERFVGMFAFALWDREERALYLARDRIGEKPLYYGWIGNLLVFGSELKALRGAPGWRGDIDRAALARFLRYGYVPAPGTIYRDIGKLPPGTFLMLRAETGMPHPEPTPYWSARSVAESGQRSPRERDPGVAVEQLDGLLRDVIARQMIADVPLGAFLSGGIDSSTVAALMQAESTRSVRTFTIGFHEASFNEAATAKAVAAHLGTDHTELYLTPREAQAVIPELPDIYDEPFADSSQIPTVLVSRLARREVTVCLSGDGGDELFGGYNRHLHAARVGRVIEVLPRGPRKVLSDLLSRPSPQAWDGALGRLAHVVPSLSRPGSPGDRLHKLADAVSADSPQDLYARLVSHWAAADAVVIGLDARGPVMAEGDEWPESLGIAHGMMYADLTTYLPDDILVKLDRASMSASLEARTPYLDHRVVEFAWALPLALKMRHRQGKWLLRQVLNRYVPKALVERPKTGFAVPLADWLRGPLRGWAESLLGESRLAREGLLQPGPIRARWEEHLTGRRNWQAHLWDVLMFQAWLERESTHGGAALTASRATGGVVETSTPVAVTSSTH